MNPGHVIEVAVLGTVSVIGAAGVGAGAALLAQTGSPSAAVSMLGSVASSIPDSVWITAAVIVATKFVISSQIKKLVELPPKQAIFEAIGTVEKLVKEYHVALLEEIRGLRKEGVVLEGRVASIEKAKELEIGIGAAMKAAKERT